MFRNTLKGSDLCYGMPAQRILDMSMSESDSCLGSTFVSSGSQGKADLSFNICDDIFSESQKSQSDCFSQENPLFLKYISSKTPSQCPAPISSEDLLTNTINESFDINIHPSGSSKIDAVQEALKHISTDLSVIKATVSERINPESNEASEILLKIEENSKVVAQLTTDVKSIKENFKQQNETIEKSAEAILEIEKKLTLFQELRKHLQRVLETENENKNVIGELISSLEEIKNTVKEVIAKLAAQDTSHNSVHNSIKEDRKDLSSELKTFISDKVENLHQSFEEGHIQTFRLFFKHFERLQKETNFKYDTMLANQEMTKTLIEKECSLYLGQNLKHAVPTISGSVNNIPHLEFIDPPLTTFRNEDCMSEDSSSMDIAICSPCDSVPECMEDNNKDLALGITCSINSMPIQNAITWTTSQNDTCDPKFTNKNAHNYFANRNYSCAWQDHFQLHRKSLIDPNSSSSVTLPSNSFLVDTAQAHSHLEEAEIPVIEPRTKDTSDVCQLSQVRESSVNRSSNLSTSNKQKSKEKSITTNKQRCKKISSETSVNEKSLQTSTVVSTSRQIKEGTLFESPTLSAFSSDFMNLNISNLLPSASCEDFQTIQHSKNAMILKDPTVTFHTQASNSQSIWSNSISTVQKNEELLFPNYSIFQTAPSLNCSSHGNNDSIFPPPDQRKFSEFPRSVSDSTLKSALYSTIVKPSFKKKVKGLVKSFQINSFVPFENVTNLQDNSGKKHSSIPAKQQQECEYDKGSSKSAQQFSLAAPNCFSSYLPVNNTKAAHVEQLSLYSNNTTEMYKESDDVHALDFSSKMLPNTHIDSRSVIQPAFIARNAERDNFADLSFTSDESESMNSTSDSIMSQINEMCNTVTSSNSSLLSLAKTAPADNNLIKLNFSSSESIPVRPDNTEGPRSLMLTSGSSCNEMPTTDAIYPLISPLELEQQSSSMSSGVALTSANFPSFGLPTLISKDTYKELSWFSDRENIPPSLDSDATNFSDASYKLNQSMTNKVVWKSPGSRVRKTDNKMKSVRSLSNATSFSSYQSKTPNCTNTYAKDLQNATVGSKLKEDMSNKKVNKFSMSDKCQSVKKYQVSERKQSAICLTYGEVRKKGNVPKCRKTAMSTPNVHNKNLLKDKNQGTSMLLRSANKPSSTLMSDSSNYNFVNSDSDDSIVFLCEVEDSENKKKRAKRRRKKRSVKSPPRKSQKKNLSVLANFTQLLPSSEVTFKKESEENGNAVAQRVPLRKVCY